jgi:hypothetical protein
MIGASSARNRIKFLLVILKQPNSYYSIVEEWSFRPENRSRLSCPERLVEADRRRLSLATSEKNSLHRAGVLPTAGCGCHRPKRGVIVVIREGLMMPLE